MTSAPHPGMRRIEGGTFTMGSEAFYQKSAR